MLQRQFANQADKMFDKDTAKIVRRHAFWGALILALPLFGLDLVIFCIILWHMYSSLCKRANTSLNFFTAIVGVGVNLIVAAFVDTALTFIPIIGWLGSGFIAYLQFYFSGKIFLEIID
ncbi:MAG: hypothetical protein ACI30X_01320 [Muribaculaceae bacterium]